MAAIPGGACHKIAGAGQDHLFYLPEKFGSAFFNNEARSCRASHENVSDLDSTKGRKTRYAPGFVRGNNQPGPDAIIPNGITGRMTAGGAMLDLHVFGGHQGNFR